MKMTLIYFIDIYFYPSFTKDACCIFRCNLIKSRGICVSPGRIRISAGGICVSPGGIRISRERIGISLKLMKRWRRWWRWQCHQRLLIRVHRRRRRRWRRQRQRRRFTVPYQFFFFFIDSPPNGFIYFLK